MAIYHCSVKTFSRSKGQSAVAAAAYRSRSKIKCENTGIIHDYSKKKDLDFNGLIIPQNSFDFGNFKNLWNAVEQKETRKNSTIAREWEIALPAEFDQKQNRLLAEHISKKLVKKFGFALQYSIHQAEGNPHVHILTSTRKLEATGFTDKIRELDQKKSGAAEESREMVANVINYHLKKNGFSERVDHRTLAAQADEALKNGEFVKAFDLSRQATRHVGRNPKRAKKIKAWNEAVKLEHERQIEALIEETQKIIDEPEEEEKSGMDFSKYTTDELVYTQEKLEAEGGDQEFLEMLDNEIIARLEEELFQEHMAQKKSLENQHPP